MMKKIKGVLFNQDGSLNGKMLASLISLGLVQRFGTNVASIKSDQMSNTMWISFILLLK